MSERTGLEALVMAAEKIIYTLPVIKEDNVLVISPHPDDETLGCGGAIIKLLSSSVNVMVILLTDGNGGGRIKDISRIRKEEFMNARAVLGYSTIDICDYPDGQLLLFQEELSISIRNILIRQTPKLVLTPYLLDHPIDHKVTNIALAQALKSMNETNIIVGMYEIWTPITNPNCYLNITEEYLQIRKAMECYQSQEEYFGIIEKADLLSTFRAKQSMRKGVKHMECYRLLKAMEYIEMVEGWMKIQHQ